MFHGNGTFVFGTSTTSLQNCSGYTSGQMSSTGELDILASNFTLSSLSGNTLVISNSEVTTTTLNPSTNVTINNSKISIQNPFTASILVINNCTVNCADIQCTTSMTLHYNTMNIGPSTSTAISTPIFTGNHNRWLINASIAGQILFAPVTSFVDRDSIYDITVVNADISLFSSSAAQVNVDNGIFGITSTSIALAPTTRPFINLLGTCSISAKNTIWNLAYDLTTQALVAVSNTVDFSGSKWNFDTNNFTSTSVNPTGIFYLYANASERFLFDNCSMQKLLTVTSAETMFLYFTGAGHSTGSLHMSNSNIRYDRGGFNSVFDFKFSNYLFDTASPVLINFMSSTYNVTTSQINAAHVSNFKIDQSLFGTASVVSGNNTITFPVPMYSLNYTVVITSVNASTGDYYIFTPVNTGFSLNVTNTVSIQWAAILTNSTILL
jgi:hypothetical protein